MRATTACNKMLAIPGANVVGVQFTPTGIVVSLRRRARRLRCPWGWSTRAVYDRSIRRWRHLDLGAARLHLQAELRRLACRRCGRVRTETVAWARPAARFTRDFEAVVADLAQRPDKTTITRLLRCSWEAVAAITVRVVAEHVDDARLDDLYRIGIDEVSYRKGHRYLTVVADPAAVKRLPPAIHDVYVTAVTASLRPIFLVAAGAAVVGFAIAWRLPELRLRATVQAGGVGDGLAAPRDADALRVMERALSVLAGREERWELYERLAVRAGVELSPPQLWLLARLGERAPTSQERLLEQLPVDRNLVTAALERLREQSLVGDPDGLITLTVSGRAEYERLVAARCAGLRELLAGWNPDEHPELRELVDKLGRNLVSQIPTPVPAAT